MDRRVRYAIDRIIAKPNAKSRTAVLAQEVSLTERRLEQLFKLETGTTFTRVALVWRMQQAEALLITTFKPVKEIASEMGYPTVEAFCRDFKKATGSAPSKYRMHFGIR